VHISKNRGLGEMHIKKRGITHIKGRNTHKRIFLNKLETVTVNLSVSENHFLKQLETVRNSYS
jgi:hypothetical protein